MQHNFLPLVDIKQGWIDRPDITESGGFSVMENAVITDRDGVAIRQGTQIIGAENTSSGEITGLYTSKLRTGGEVMLRSSNNRLEFYNPLTSAWELLKDGYTDGEIFGFQDHSLYTGEHYVYFCNAVEPYSRWRSEAYGITGATASGGNIVVDTTLKPTVYFTDTASLVSSTSIAISSAKWYTDQWKDFYVLIKDGASAGEVRKITSNTTTTLTIDSLSGLSGTPTFEIRELKYPVSGTVIVNGTEETYTDITKETELTATASQAYASGVSVALVPEEFKEAPRGNILAILYTQMFVAGVKKNPTTLYRAKITDATDFTFSSPRVSGEGDVIDIPDARPKINDLNIFEDRLIVGGDSHIEQIVFTQDGNDLPNRTPLMHSSLLGIAGRSSRMGDDVVFANLNKEITTLGRVANKDYRASRRNIAWDISRALKNYDFSSQRVYTYKNYTLIACKESSNSTTNDIVLVYDNNRSRWVGRWNLPISNFTEYNGDLYGGSSASREVYKLFASNFSQKKETSEIGYKMRIATQWVNQTKDQAHQQIFDTIFVKGYIKTNTTVKFSLFYNREGEASYTWIFDPADNSSVANTTAINNIGTNPLGVNPLGVVIDTSEVGEFGEYPFIAYFKVKKRPHNYVKLEIEVDGIDKYLEITDIRTNTTQLDVLNDNYIIDTEV